MHPNIVTQSTLIQWSNAQNFDELMDIVLTGNNLENKHDFKTIKKVNSLIKLFFNKNLNNFTKPDLKDIKKIQKLIYSISNTPVVVNELCITTTHKDDECKHDNVSLKEKQKDEEKQLKSKFKFKAVLTQLERVIEVIVGYFEKQNQNKLHPAPTYLSRDWDALAAYSPLNYWMTEFLKQDGKPHRSIHYSLNRSIEFATIKEIVCFVERIYKHFQEDSIAWKQMTQAFFLHASTRWHSLFFEEVFNNSSKDFFDSVIEAIPNKLTRLSLSKSKIEDHHLETILKNLKQIKTLDLSHCVKLTDEGIKKAIAMHPMPSLEELILNDTNASEETFEHICKIVMNES